MAGSTTEKSNLKGCIKQIVCTAFMAFDHMEVEMGQFFNIIIGPNGCGKSTLAAAIVLGFGGEPKQLSRSAHIQEYIKNGCSEAIIAIHVFAANSKSVVVFKRIIHIDGTNNFYIGTSNVKKKAFKERISTLNIDIGNLCQFLPQDRVQDFAKMTPHDLFTSTIDSTCDVGVGVEFKKLKDMQKAQEAKNQTTNDMKHSLDIISKRVNELEGKMEHYRTRQNISRKIKVCSAKKLWLEVKEDVEALVTLQSDLQQAESMLEARKKACRISQNNYDKIESEFEKLSSGYEELKRNERRLTACKDQMYEKIVESQSNMKRLEQTFLQQKEFARGLEENMFNATRILTTLISDCKELSDADPKAKVKYFTLEREKLKQKIKDLTSIRNDINTKLDRECTAELNATDHQLNTRDGTQLKKKFLEDNRTSRDVMPALKWIEQNQSRFKGKIYQPIILEINVRARDKIKYFENTIGAKDLFAFVCEEKDDVQLLAKELCTKQNYRVNVGYSATSTECKYKSDGIESLRVFGFTDYLIDLIDGPPTILNYLCDLYSLHRIPIGTDKVGTKLEEIPTHIKTYFGGDYRYTVTQSSYSDDLSRMQKAIIVKNWPLDDNEAELTPLRRKRQALVAKSDALKNKRSSLEAQINDQLGKEKEIIVKKNEAMQNEEKLRMKVEQTKSKKAEVMELRAACDLTEAKNAVKRDIDKEGKKLPVLINKFIDAFTELAAAQRKRQCVDSEITLLEKEKDDERAKLRAAKELLSRMQITYESTKKSVLSVKSSKTAKEIEAKRLTDNLSPDDPSFPYTNIYKSLPNDLPSVIQSLNELTARLACMGDEDRQAMEEYLKKSNESKDLDKKIREICLELAQDQIQTEQLYNKWVPAIKNAISNVNDNFGNFMATMGYVGEVALAKHGDLDFMSYGIEIRVQYRANVPLQRLSRTLQSGGERAVAIGTYTLALLCINNVPFGCVDEINQGMDPINERTFLQMLLKETSLTDRPQYIYISPKMPTGMLADLDMKRVNVTIVTTS